jgi:hypothetical protein
MQMLQAGGVLALTDSVRTPDADNPRGYLEFERVKKIKTDKAWLDDAAGKAVKIIHLLLMDLPDDREYRVLFLRRDLHEVVRSQAKMLERSGRQGAAMSADKLIEVFRTQVRTVLAWLAARPNFRVLEIEYAQIVANPIEQARSINSFLGGALDERAMAGSVDPSLYRNRA